MFKEPKPETSAYEKDSETLALQALNFISSDAFEDRLHTMTSDSRQYVFDFRFTPAETHAVQSDAADNHKSAIRLGTFTIQIGEEEHGGVFYLTKDSNEICVRDKRNQEMVLYRGPADFRSEHSESRPISFDFQPLEQKQPSRPLGWRRVSRSQMPMRASLVDFQRVSKNIGTQIAVYVDDKLAFPDITRLEVPSVSTDGDRPKPAMARGDDGHEYYITFFHDGSVSAIYRA